MNRFVSSSLLVFSVLILLVRCNKPESKSQTISNLKIAYKNEITKAEQYAAYAQKTREEGMDRLSVLFLTVSKARHICADNYKTAIEELGAFADTSKVASEVKTTIENLQAAVELETHDFTILYPEFAETANEAKATHAEQLFTWQQQTEKKDILYYKDAIKAIEQRTTNAFYTFYLICPHCGNVYYPHQVEDQCENCSTKKEKFIPVG